MFVIIRSEKGNIEAIKDECLNGLRKRIGGLDYAKEDDVVAEIINEESYKVYYPSGELYGYVWDYVEGVYFFFKKLKKKYNNIEVQGLVYAYDEITSSDAGFYFYCSPEDKDLYGTQNWQKCAICGKVFETDTYYNSAIWSGGDESQGTRDCLCSPLHELEYALLKYSHNKVGFNDSVDKEDLKRYVDKGFSEYAWNKVINHFNDYCKFIDEGETEYNAFLRKTDLNKKRVKKIEEMIIGAHSNVKGS